MITKTVGGKRDCYELIEMSFLSLQLWLRWVCSTNKSLHIGLLQCWCLLRAVRVLLQLQSTSPLALKSCFPKRSPLLSGLTHALLFFVNTGEAPFPSCYPWITLLLTDCLQAHAMLCQYHLPLFPVAACPCPEISTSHLPEVHQYEIPKLKALEQLLTLSLITGTVAVLPQGVCGSYSHAIFPMWSLSKIKSRPRLPCRGRADR